MSSNTNLTEYGDNAKEVTVCIYNEWSPLIPEVSIKCKVWIDTDTCKYIARNAYFEATNSSRIKAILDWFSKATG